VTIDDSGFKYVRQLVRERAAIVLEEGKQYLVANRLSVLARREGLGSAQEVIDRLRAAPSGPLQRKVIEAMTTTETLFFRDGKPYEALRNTILPELQRMRAADRKLQIWSCACSSGQEPYSLAMLIREHFPALTSWNVQIVATDISTEMLARSRAGRYSQLEVNRGLPAPMLVRYFTRVGMHWQVAEDLRRMVTTELVNLAEPWPVLPPFDLIFMRNVLSYFDVPTKQTILGRVRRQLRPDGLLLLGGAETTMNLDANFERVPIGRSNWYRPTTTA